MQFNSYEFIFLFLPLFLIIYFLGNHINDKLNRWLIILAGFIFYSFTGLSSFIVFLISVLLNYVFSRLLIISSKYKRVVFTFAVLFNVLTLLVYKLWGVLDGLVLPLGISFFTFQQIMFLSYVSKENIQSPLIIDYLAYISFFPKLLMGPLAEPEYIIDQINDPVKKRVNWHNIAAGLKLFSFGLFKKMVLADTFARCVNWGFDSIESATSGDLFLVMISYTFQIYFDFCGYFDMAVGTSKMLNIELPNNFDSPYKATSIKEFWRRWHISLTSFFTKYVYYPLGGNRKGRIRTYVNIMIVFLVSGLWHGSNWTFILWGGIHGGLQVLERVFSRFYKKTFEVVQWIYSFTAINILWLLFRADSVSQWHYILYKIFTFQSTAISDEVIELFDLTEINMILQFLKVSNISSAIRGFSMLLIFFAGFFICLVPENNYKTREHLNLFNMILAAVAFTWGILCLNTESVFVYYGF